MINEPNKYRIHKIQDLLSIPEDKQLACLEDLNDWITFNRKLRNHIPAKIEIDFTWVDDNKKGLSEVNVEIKKQSE